MNIRALIFKRIGELKNTYSNIQDEILLNIELAKTNKQRLDPVKLQVFCAEMIVIERELDTLCILVASADDE